MRGERDEAIGLALDRMAKAIEAEPVDRLPEVLRRGSRRRAARFGAIVAAVVVFAGAVTWAGLSIGGGIERIPADIADWRTFGSLDENGWTVQVPPPWRVQELPACENAPERIGVVVTNTDFEFISPRGGAPQCEDRFVFAGFPRDGVALAFHPRGSIIGLFEPPADTTLPLTPELLIRSGGIVGGPAHSFQSVVVHGETVGVIRRYVGPEASASDVAALDRMLASFWVRGAPRWVDDAVPTFGRLSVKITRPEGWDVTGFEQPMVIDAPQPLLRLASPGVDEGHCPNSFLWGDFDNLSDLGVVIVVSDASTAFAPPDLGARPAGFRPGVALEDRTIDCGAEIRVLRFGFEEARRPIFVDVAVTSAYLREEPGTLRHILDSIGVSET